MLPFYSVARAALRVISQLLTISNWTELTGPGTEQKGKRFPRGGKQRLWKYLKCHLPLSQSRNVVDIQNARAAVKTKAVGRVKGCQV